MLFRSRVPIEPQIVSPHSELDTETWKQLFNEFHDGELSVAELAKKFNVYQDEVTDFVKRENARRKRNEDSFKKNNPQTYSRINRDMKFAKEDALEAIRDGRIKNWDDLANWALRSRDAKRNALDDRAERELFRAFPEGTSPDGNSKLNLGFKPSARENAAGKRIRTIVDSENKPKDFQSLRPAMRRSAEDAASAGTPNERAAQRRAMRVERNARPSREVFSTEIGRAHV